jgi:hypothetical protein
MGRTGKSEAKFTPGPWRVEGANQNLVYAADGWIADVRAGVKGSLSKVAQANTHLIAAAPDLYAKCEKIVAWLTRLAEKAEASAKDTRFITLAEASAADAKNYRATISDIESALRKARGETPPPPVSP